MVIELCCFLSWSSAFICDPNPCLNQGTCQASSITGNGYQCSCPLGYSGQNCQSKLTNCIGYQCCKFQRTGIEQKVGL